MRRAAMVAACAAVVVVAPMPVRAGSAERPVDVPVKHWAAPAVVTVIGTGVLTAPNDRFSGERKVTRHALISSLVRLAKLLEQRKWPETTPVPVKEGRSPAGWQKQQVTRYELAASIVRVAPYALAGLPSKPAAKPFDSKALPQSPSLKAVPRTSPAYRELEYLVKRRLVWPGSVLLKPGTQPITGEQLAAALTQLVSGLSGTMTDEPQNRPDLGREQRRP